MASPFDQRFPNLAAWIQDGWIELGRDDFSHSFIRVLDIGGLVWEGEDEYESTDAALADAEVAVIAWFGENGR